MSSASSFQNVIFRNADSRTPFSRGWKQFPVSSFQNPLSSWKIEEGRVQFPEWVNERSISRILLITISAWKSGMIIPRTGERGPPNEGWRAYSFRLTITGEPERANAQRVAQRYGKDNPEVFIPCRHLHTNFGACVTSVFLTGHRALFLTSDRV